MGQSRFEKLMVAVAMVALAGISGCRQVPRAVIEDYDSFQTVDLGPAHYVTPNGVRETRHGRGFVEHKVDSLPGTLVRVDLDPHPPRDVKFDADAEKRRFLDELNDSFLRSAQYSSYKGTQKIKVIAHSADDEGKPLYGTLMMVRTGSNTATIRAVGPREQQTGINRVVEDMAAALHLDVPEIPAPAEEDEDSTDTMVAAPTAAPGS